MSTAAPSAADYAANKGPTIVGVNIMVAVLTTIAVTLRVVARRVQKSSLQADDYSIILAVPFGWASCITVSIAAMHGLGRHLNTLTPQMLVTEGQAFFASELIWAASILIIKISILLLYIRLFGRLRYIRLWVYWLSTFSACWAIMVILVCSFQCRPLRFVWDKSINGTCVNVSLFFIVGSVPNVLTDFVILALPLPAVFALQTSRGQKISLVAIFMLGSITCIISLVRLIELILIAKTSDPTWSLGILGLLSTAEACLGIVAACLPTLRPLFIKILAQSKRGSNDYDSADSSAHPPPPSHGRPKVLRADDSGGFQPLYGARMETSITSVTTQEKGWKMGMGGPKSIPLNAIGVSTTTTLVK